jgi:hypothetical protein
MFNTALTGLGGVASGLYYTYHRGTKLAQTDFTVHTPDPHSIPLRDKIQ